MANIFSRAAHGLAHLAGQAVHVVKKAISNPIIDAALGAALIATGVGAPVVGAIEGFAKKVGGAVGGIAETLASTAGGAVGDALRTVAGIIEPIAKVVESVAQQVRDINEHLIQPIVGPIETAIEESHALVKAIQADLHGGITGLLRIPSSIADALTSVDASLQRAMTQLGAFNAQVVEHVLNPAILQAGAEPLGAVAEAIHGIGRSPEPAEPFLKSIQIEEPQDVGQFMEKLASYQRDLKVDGGFIARIILSALDVTEFIPALMKFYAPRETYYESEAYKALPTKPLDPATVIAALLRGITPEDSGHEELKRNGIDPSRYKILEELSHPLPGVGDLTTMRDRNEVSADQYLDIMRRLGWDQDDAQRLWRIAHTIPGVSDVIQMQHRMDSAIHGLATKTVLSLPPEPVIAAGQRAGIDSDAIGATWVNHWQLLGYALWVQAYYRRMVTHDDVLNAMDASAIPSELQQMLIDVSRPLIQFRSIPGLVASGIWDKSKGIDALKQHGYSDSDSEALLEYALRKARPSATDHAPTLHALSVNESLLAYENATLSRDETEQLLREHKLDDRAISVMLKLADVKAERIRRSTGIADIVAEVESGLLTLDDAISALHRLGLGTGEVAKAVARIQRAQRQRTKLPGLGDVQKMFKHNIISEQVAGDTLSLLGYTPEWVTRFLSLWGAEPAPSPAPATT